MTVERQTKRKLFSRGTWAFIAFQLVFLSLAMASAVHRSGEIRARRALPELREVPLTVRPRYDDSRVVTDQQLEMVLAKLRPKLRLKRVRMNHVDHALRFWGASAQFKDRQFLSGEEMRRLLVDHTEFVRYWGPKSRPFLVANEDGSIQVRQRQGHATSSHEDHTLACLAEVGTPLSFPIRTTAGVNSLRELVEQALVSFSLNQVEYEWSGLVFALYVKPTNHWVSTEGQAISFDSIAERLMRLRYHKGVCFGNHRLHTLTVMLRVDEQERILSAEMRKEIITHLLNATKRLVKNQDPTGCWDQNWPYKKPDEKLAHKMQDSLSRRILATGHALEWWAFAPPEVLPPRQVIVKAGQWMARTVTEMSDKDIQKGYTFLTHAGRALALWRGGFTADVWRRLKNKTKSESKT